MSSSEFVVPRALAARVLACLGVAFACLALLLDAAHAQGSKTLVSNTGQAEGLTGELVDDQRQRFATGSTTAGYVTTRLMVHCMLANAAGTTDPTMEIGIWSSDANGKPNSKIGNFSNPTTLNGGVSTFAATGTGIELASYTTHVLVVDVTKKGARGPFNRFTTSKDEDSGAATGWSIADTTHYRTAGSGGGRTTYNAVPEIVIVGYEKTNHTPRVLEVHGATCRYITDTSMAARSFAAPSGSLNINTSPNTRGTETAEFSTTCTSRGNQVAPVLDDRDDDTLIITIDSVIWSEKVRFSSGMPRETGRGSTKRLAVAPRNSSKDNNNTAQMHLMATDPQGRPVIALVEVAMHGYKARPAFLATAGALCFAKDRPGATVPPEATSDDFFVDHNWDASTPKQNL